MNVQKNNPEVGSTRREFLRRSGSALAGTALAGSLVKYGQAGESNTIKVALIGCGGRGTGAAANALSTSGPTKLWAMADVFDHRLDVSFKSLATRFGQQVDVPPERRFIGLDAYRKAIDALDSSDVVLLTTPPAFRPIHLEYAVEKGRHVFMEKSFAVDAPGVRRVRQAGQLAQQKNLKIAGGLMWRHCQPREQTIEHLQNGKIGEIITLWAYRMHGPVGCRPRQPDMSELAYQIQNYSNFTWLNGSFIVDWLIHDIDVCCWIKNAWPVSAQGQGGRQVRTEPDQMYDHFAVEYSFADGARLVAQGRHMRNCWGFFGDVIHGSHGSAVMMEGSQYRPRIYKGLSQTADNESWRYDGPLPDPYQVEHDLLFQAIREDRPHNEVERCAHAVMAAILGRMAAESGQTISWDEALASQVELAPGLAGYSWDSNPPAMPDAQNRYPIAMPGVTRVL